MEEPARGEGLVKVVVVAVVLMVVEMVEKGVVYVWFGEEEEEGDSDGVFLE